MKQCHIPIYIYTHYGYHLLKHTQIVWVSSTDTLKFALVSSTYTYTTVLISFTKKMHRVSVYHLLIHTQLSGYLPKHTQIVWVSSINTYTNFTSIIYIFIQKMSGYHLSIHTQIVWELSVRNCFSLMTCISKAIIFLFLINLSNTKDCKNRNIKIEIE